MEWLDYEEFLVDMEWDLYWIWYYNPDNLRSGDLDNVRLLWLVTIQMLTDLDAYVARQRTYRKE